MEPPLILAVLDAWYNSQTCKNGAGNTLLFHYKWDDYGNSGYSLFGHIFRSYGVETKTLPAAPTADALHGAQFYIIVSPDNPSKTPEPHYMSARDAEQVAAWVKQGGVLIMMENDPDNADITHFDPLAGRSSFAIPDAFIYKISLRPREPEWTPHHLSAFFKGSVGCDSTSTIRRAAPPVSSGPLLPAVG